VVGLAHSFPNEQDWLFPGRRAGQPIGDKGLNRQLSKMGIPARSAGNTAPLELARDAPTAILADILGVAPETAVKWRQLAGGSWTIYGFGEGSPGSARLPRWWPALKAGGTGHGSAAGTDCLGGDVGRRAR
jgi:hypothetical protein